MDYHGFIDPVEVTNEYPGEGHIPGFTAMSEHETRYVHYPDCQQLIIWLPSPGQDYSTYRFIRMEKDILEEGNISEILNGSIQLIWDTVALPPAAYKILICHKSGGRHIIQFVKHEAGWMPEPKPLPPQTDAGPVVYRDGFGNVLVDEDLVLRKAITEKIIRTFSRRISYEGNARSGYVIYTDNNCTIRFYNEMGGGNCMFYIAIPTEENWEAETKTPLSERAAIVEYVATAVKAVQAPGCRYAITSNTINFCKD